jgi:hypothetical protein
MVGDPVPVQRSPQVSIEMQVAAATELMHVQSTAGPSFVSFKDRCVASHLVYAF